MKGGTMEMIQSSVLLPSMDDDCVVGEDPSRVLEPQCLGHRSEEGFFYRVACCSERGKCFLHTE